MEKAPLPSSFGFPSSTTKLYELVNDLWLRCVKLGIIPPPAVDNTAPPIALLDTDREKPREREEPAESRRRKLLSKPFFTVRKLN